MSGFTLETKLEGAEEVMTALNNSPALLKQAMKVMLTTGALIAEGTAKEKAPAQNGVLRGSISHKVFDDYAIVGTNVEYAKYQEYGTGIYGKTGQPIRPRNAKVLSFVIGGTRVFAREVRGTPAKKFMEAGLKMVQSKIATVIAKGRQLVVDNMFK